MPASDHPEPVNIKNAPVLSSTVADRAKVFRIAKSMVKKRVPNYQSLQTDALNHLEQCLEKETRQARSQLERTLEDYLGWCSEWDLPCLPVFSLVAALHIYDGSVDAHDKSELTAKDLRSRRRWLSNLSWIADRANPYFQAINTHKAGADFIGPLILGDAVQEITQMDAEGQYWEDKLEPQPAPPEASTSKACSSEPQPSLIVKPTPAPASNAKHGKAKGKARVVPSDSETPSSDEDEDDNVPLRKRKLGSSSRTPPPPTVQQQSSPPVDPALVHISPDKSQMSDSPGQKTQDPRKRLAPDIHMPSFKRKKQVHTSQADPRLLLIREGATSQATPKSASTSSPAPRVDIADLAAKRKERQRQRRQSEQEATETDEDSERRQSLERAAKEKQQEAERQRKEEEERKRKEREAEQQRAKQEQEAQARKQAEQEAEVREKAQRQRAETEQQERERERDLEAERQRILREEQALRQSEQEAADRERQTREAGEQQQQHIEAEAEGQRLKKLHPEPLLAEKQAEAAEQQGSTDEGKQVEPVSRETTEAAPWTASPAELLKQVSKGTSPYVLAPASSASNAAPPAPAVQPVDDSTFSALMSSASTSGPGLTSAAPQNLDQAVEGSPMEPGQIDEDDDAIELIGVTPALGSKPGVPRLPPHPSQHDNSWSAISNRTLQRALGGLPTRHRNVVSDSGFRHLFHHLPPSIAATAAHKRKASPDPDHGSADQPVKEPRLTMAALPTNQASTNGHPNNMPQEDTTRRPALSISTGQQSSPVVADSVLSYGTNDGLSRPASALPRLEPSQADSHPTARTELPQRPFSATFGQQHDQQWLDTVSKGKATGTPGQTPPLLEATLPPNLSSIADPKVAEILRRGTVPTAVPYGQPPSPGLTLPRLPVRGASLNAFGRCSIAVQPILEHPVLPVVNPAPVPQAMSLTLSKPNPPSMHVCRPLYNKVITDLAHSVPCVCFACVKGMRRFMEGLQKGGQRPFLPGSQPMSSAAQAHQERTGLSNAHASPIPGSVPPRPSSAPLSPSKTQRRAPYSRAAHGGPPSREATGPSAGASSFLSRSSGAPTSTSTRPSNSDIAAFKQGRAASSQAPTSEASVPSQGASTHMVAGPELMTLPPPFGRPAPDRTRIPPLNVVAGVAWYHVRGMEPPYDFAPHEALPEDVAKLRNDFEGTLHFASHHDYFGASLATFFIALNEEVFTGDLRRRVGEVLWAKINQHQYPGAMRDLINQLSRLSSRLVGHSAGWLCQCLRQKHADVEQLYLLLRYGSIGFFKSLINDFPMPLFASASRPPGPGQPDMVPPSAVPNHGAGGSSTMVPSHSGGAGFSVEQVRQLLHLQHSRLQEQFREATTPSAMKVLPPTSAAPRASQQPMQHFPLQHQHQPQPQQQQSQRPPTQYVSPAQLSMSRPPSRGAR